MYVCMYVNDLNTNICQVIADVSPKMYIKRLPKIFLKGSLAINYSESVIIMTLHCGGGVQAL